VSLLVSFLFLPQAQFSETNGMFRDIIITKEYSVLFHSKKEKINKDLLRKKLLQRILPKMLQVVVYVFGC
jgi:hypothetical protein